MVPKVESMKDQNSCVGLFKAIKGDMKLQKGSLKWKHDLTQFDKGTRYIGALVLQTGEYAHVQAKSHKHVQTPRRFLQA